MSSDFPKAAQLGAGRVKGIYPGQLAPRSVLFHEATQCDSLAEGAQWGSPACPLALWSVACVVSEHRGLELFPERREAPTLARGPALSQHQPQTLSAARGGRTESGCFS